MKRKIKTGMIALGCCILVMTGVYGAFTDRLSVTSHIVTGDVHIGIQEFTRINKIEKNYTDPGTILPGMKISKIPRIINKGMPCWIRARLIFSNKRDSVEGLDESNIKGISEKWIKKGDYYYYKKILGKSESADFFQEVSVPKKWDNEHALQKLGIEIRAEAIQAANFKPDFTAMSPWGNQTIQECVHEENGQLLKQKEKQKMSVEFNGKAHKLLAVPDDFFGNLGAVMPGDECKDTITVSNTTGQEAEIFFQTSVKGRNKLKKQILKEIKLKIYLDKKLKYRGTLDSRPLEENHSLGVFESGQERELEFVLEIPKEWDNSRAMKETDVTWIFTVDNDETDISVNEKENSSGYRESANSQTQSHEASRKNSVKTGDESRLYLFVLLLVSSGIFVVAVAKNKKEGDGHD